MFLNSRKNFVHIVLTCVQNRPLLMLPLMISWVDIAACTYTNQNNNNTQDISTPTVKEVLTVINDYAIDLLVGHDAHNKPISFETRAPYQWFAWAGRVIQNESMSGKEKEVSTKNIIEWEIKELSEGGSVLSFFETNNGVRIGSAFRNEKSVVIKCEKLFSNNIKILTNGSIAVPYAITQPKRTVVDCYTIDSVKNIRTLALLSTNILVEGQNFLGIDATGKIFFYEEKKMFSYDILNKQKTNIGNLLEKAFQIMLPGCEKSEKIITPIFSSRHPLAIFNIECTIALNDPKKIYNGAVIMHSYDREKPFIVIELPDRIEFTGWTSDGKGLKTAEKDYPWICAQALMAESCAFFSTGNEKNGPAWLNQFKTIMLCAKNGTRLGSLINTANLFTDKDFFAEPKQLPKKNKAAPGSAKKVPLQRIKLSAEEINALTAFNKKRGKKEIEEETEPAQDEVKTPKKIETSTPRKYDLRTRKSKADTQQ